MFGWKRKELPEVTNEVYLRWLRAQRPPWLWFLGLGQVEQEQLALIGDDYIQDICIGIGWAVKDPELASTGSESTESPEYEETLLRRLTEAFGQRAAQASPEPARVKPPLSMGGVTKRREEKAEAKQADRDESRSFAGRRPDSIEGASA